MKVVNCICGGSAVYTVSLNYKGIGVHSVRCTSGDDVCGIAMFGSDTKVGKKEIINRWNTTFKEKVSSLPHNKGSLRNIKGSLSYNTLFAMA